MIKKLKELRVVIKSILGGFAPTWYLGGEDEYLNALAIDPEKSYKGKPIGAIFPTQTTPLAMNYSTGLGTAPMWITSCPTTTGVFVYGANGTIYSFSAGLVYQDYVAGGLVQVTNGTGNGMCVYNDYLYLASPTDIARFGPLSATAPTMVQNYWGDSDTGLSQSDLTNTTYYGGRNITYPNHVLHAHNDGYVYVADYASGQGMIHSFSVSSAGATTAAYADLLLPPGYIPTDIKSYGTDLAVLCSPMAKFTTGSIPKAGNSLLVLWDTVSDNFYRSVPINEELSTAMAIRNGELYVLTGSGDNHVKLFKYLGGYSFQSLADMGEGTPPPAGAVDVLGNMIAWGAYGTVPTTFAGVFAYGYRGIPGNAMNCIMRISNTTDTYPVVSALKFVNPSSGYPLVGWRTDTSASYGIDRYATDTAHGAIFKTKVFQVGSQFNIRRIRIPLAGYVSADTVITPTVYLDDEITSQALPVINRDNYPNQDRIIDYTDLAIGGLDNFYIGFVWSSTTSNATSNDRVGLAPNITIDTEAYD